MAHMLRCRSGRTDSGEERPLERARESSVLSRHRELIGSTTPVDMGSRSLKGANETETGCWQLSTGQRRQMVLLNRALR